MRSGFQPPAGRFTLQADKAYTGTILKVDLANGRTQEVPTAAYARRFLGGRGLATALYWNEVPPGIDPFDERNRLIFALGPLAGFPGVGCSRWGAYAKSPFPPGGRFCYGNLGGSFGAELKFAGYDALVLQGRADDPVVLSIRDREVRLRPAGELWGATTTRTIESLRQGDAAKVLAIGPAGEKLLAYATLFADGDASCSGGLGAVMGSKNLKAITVSASRRAVQAARPDCLRELAREMRNNGRGNVKVWGLDFMAHGENTRKLPCYGCPAHCLRVKYTAADGRSGKFMCQSRFFYMPHAWGYYGQENDVPFFANRLCDELGIDTWEVQAIVEWLLRCHAEGLLSEGEAGLPLAKVGSLEFIDALLRGILEGRDFAGLLARGAQSAARERGAAAWELFRRNDPYDPRYCPVNTMLYPFEPREPIQQLHEAGLTLAQWSSWAKGVEGAHLSSEVVRGIARRFWGGEAAADFTTLEGKALAARRIQDRQYAKECLVSCDWMYPVMDLPNSPDHVGDPTIESRILSAATGVDVSPQELDRFGERLFALQRAVLLREGHRARRDDFLPEEWHERGLEGHVADPDCLVPGRHGEAVSRIGARVDRKAFLALRDEYYRLRGWDVPTGLMTREGLARLDLPEVASDLETRGLLAARARPAPALLRLARRLRPPAGWRTGEQAGRGGPDDSRQRSHTAALSPGELLGLLEEQRAKFADPRIAHNFGGWNKVMQYHISDAGLYFRIRLVDGVAQPPEPCAAPVEHPDISYQMDSETLRAMTRGEISGQEAYLKRRLRLRASFTEMLKLQSLNGV
jgi:aldehyde:ferredoxin oxidoreductase